MLEVRSSGFLGLFGSSMFDFWVMIDEIKLGGFDVRSVQVRSSKFGMFGFVPALLPVIWSLQFLNDLLYYFRTFFM